jgi:gas vesicle protein
MAVEGVARIVIRESGCYHPISNMRVGGLFMSDSNSNSFLWFLAGLGIGAVAGVLYAPRSGDETRQALRARAEDSREFVRDRARQAREQASTWADRGREVLNQQKEQFRSAYEAGKQAYQEATASTEGGGKQNP